MVLTGAGVACALVSLENGAAASTLVQHDGAGDASAAVMVSTMVVVLV